MAEVVADGRTGLRVWLRQLGWILLFCYGLAFLLHLTILLDNLPQRFACADGWYGSLAPKGIDLREALGLPCKIRPLRAAVLLLVMPLVILPYLVPLATGSWLLFRRLRAGWRNLDRPEEPAASAQESRRRRWRSRAKGFGLWLAMTYLFAFGFNFLLLVSMGSESDWNRPEALCSYYPGYPPPPGAWDILDLQSLGWPCVLEPGKIAIFLYVMPVFFTPLVAIFAGLLVWAVMATIRDPWGGGPEVVLLEAAGAGVSPRPAPSPSGPGRS